MTRSSFKLPLAVGLALLLPCAAFAQRTPHTDSAAVGGEMFARHREVTTSVAATKRILAA